MAWDDRLQIGGFCDEVCRSRNLELQLAVSAALGMEFVTLRFLDLGAGIQNILQLSDEQAGQAAAAVAAAGLQTACLGTPLGKVKLFDREDGSPNRYRDPGAYLEEEVERACRIARILGCRLLRGFSFYHPAGSDPARFVDAAVARLRPIVERCDADGLTFGLEVEANLVGQNGELLAAIHQGVGHPALVLVFDGANLVTQGYPTEEVLRQWQLMEPGIGWIHVKDYRPDPALAAASGPLRRVDEESLSRYVPAGEGAAGYDRIFGMLMDAMPSIRRRLEPRGIEGVLVDLEPHLAGGGQFGGYSGPAEFGRGLRALQALLARGKIGCRLRG